jgi:hypothetical protein
VEESSILAHVNADTANKTAEVRPIQVRKTAPVSLPQHFYKPSQLPNTWSKVKYMEDSAELFPVLSKPSFEIAEITNKTLASSEPVDNFAEKNVPIKTSAETRISITRTAPRRSLPASFDLPRKEVKVPAVRPIQTLEKRPAFSIGPRIALVGAAAALILAYGVIFTSWTTNTADLANTVYVASAFSAVQSAFGVFLASSIVQGGLAGVLSFFSLIFQSFWIFVSKGITFLQSLY